ncbi:efflux RND transporter permease subunit [Marasmitruncus massiliensis]|uniref:efflux RND transporter permease subunit n=1 Tax=Marasmitruncus massiliensis TaxID=1944642 RepID=UPI00241CC823|nr:efflux RND transporter permease subunit [Marasmitruncus massiliensis]
MRSPPLSAILMSAPTTVFGMLPVALEVGSGTEMMQGMAVIIIGGLLAGTILTLLVLPGFCLLFNKKQRSQEKSLLNDWVIF